MKAGFCSLWLFLAALVGCGTPAVPLRAPSPKAIASPPSVDALLQQGAQALARSQYQRARQRFEQVLLSTPDSAPAQLGAAEVALLQGRYPAAMKLALQVFKSPLEPRAGTLFAEAAWRSGEAVRALEVLAPLAEEDSAYGAKLWRGFLLIQTGEREAAEAPLMEIIEAYNEALIEEQDGLALGYVARAAQLLRSAEDANDAYNLAEQASGHQVPLLLWRARLFLENHNSEQATQVLEQVLQQAPAHPVALSLLAGVQLDEALDFDEARRLARRALQVNPHLSEAHEVLVGIALRDGQLEDAAAAVTLGLRSSPRDLRLLSLAAAVEFLRDEDAAFERAKSTVLALNPEYSSLFNIVGTYAEWEHRYDEIIELMGEALRIDSDNAHARGLLGLNLIRAGQEEAGLLALRKAFEEDPYNVRVFNTLNLYEKVIASEYVNATGSIFRFRYPKAEREVLARYVPPLLASAWKDFRQGYSFEPQTPVGIELYAERSHFAVRTSGLPHTAIQGVCFGRTLATLTPNTEQFNLPMTVWHELAHVFHIQLSNNRVPRWFTEGLAEWETQQHRARWQRERDAELYEAWREGKLPKLGRMNEAFTHAEDGLDVTVAYYASTQIVGMLIEDFGRPALNRMLRAWGEGKDTQEVFLQVLGQTAEQLDTRFQALLKTRLARYRGQFVPVQRVGSVKNLKERVKRQPGDLSAAARLAFYYLRERDNDAAEGLLTRILKEDPKHADGLWLAGRLALRRGRTQEARAYAEKLLAEGHGGYESELLLASTLLENERDAVRAALLRAHQYDPSKADALHGLWRLARDKQDVTEQDRWLSKLVALEEHDADSAIELVELFLRTGRSAEAADVAEHAIQAGLERADAHLAAAKAYAAAGRQSDALFEYESAALCRAPLQARTEAYQALVQYWMEQGNPERAAEYRRRSNQLPELAR